MSGARRAGDALRPPRDPARRAGDARATRRAPCWPAAPTSTRRPRRPALARPRPRHHRPRRARAASPATAGGLRIGACTTWSAIRDAALPPAFDALRAAAAEVGGGQIQNAGTIGGNLCNASPAADGVPPLLALDAEVELASAAGTRRLPLAAFLRGPRRTDRRPGEMLTAVLIPAAALRRPLGLPASSAPAATW